MALATLEADSTTRASAARHPRGLQTLFFTEMWERFSYYGMRAFLILYMTAPVAAGGLGFDDARAGSIYGTYTGSIWLVPVFGGLIADRLLGAYRSVLYGGIIIALGHFTLAFKSLPFFYSGLALIVIGTGLLKPNATTMLGSLYAPRDARRDAGFSIFYMGINLGAFIGPLIAGWLADQKNADGVKNWHVGFACAGVGMTIGVIQYVLSSRSLQPSAEVTAAYAAERAGQSSAALTKAADARTTGFTPTEWKRMGAVVVFFLFATFFWAAYEQAATTLNLFGDRHVDRFLFGWQFPASWFVSIQALFVIVLSPAFALLWTKLGPREPATPMKFALGLALAGVSFILLLPAGTMALSSDAVRVSPLWLVAAYFLQVSGELCLSPVGNSVVTKLAPVKVVGLMMGVWFLSISAGNKLAGWSAGLAATIPFPTLFGTIAAITLFAALVLVGINRPIRRLMGGVR
jgi:POT family proton-dependent oligopeptide transporter